MMGVTFLEENVYIYGMEKWKIVEINRQTVWEVSDQGRIRKNGEVVNPRKGSSWGRYVRFKGNTTLHRTVAEFFIPNPENLPCVNHIDGDRQNNKASNLEWVTSAGNAQHSYQNDLQIIKLNDQQRRELVELLLKNESPTKLAKQFGISLRNVYYYKQKLG